MRYRSLGRTGIKVSPYALGAMMFGAIGNPNHDESIRIIHRALDAGINLVDTADMYSHGESEQIVGKALRDRRADVVLATKARLPMGDDPNHQGASRRWLVRALEDSLRRLGTDYVDLYQVHRPDPDTDLEETLAALTDLQRAGKVRAFGISSLPASEIVRAHWVSERRGLAGCAPSNPSTRSSTGASSARCCRWRRSSAWARWSGRRSAAGCSPVATAGVRTPPRTGRSSASCTSRTISGWTSSSS
jgi:aryl-alcohol dehydrogenase-like predicted oxidoreductase